MSEQVSKKPRDSKFEVLRLAAMFLILTCHFTIHSGWNLQQEPGWKGAFADDIVELAQVGVVIFFIISGYFLCRKAFSWLRLVRTWLQVFLFSVLSYALVSIGFLSGHFSSVGSWYSGSNGVMTAVSAFLPISTMEYWFITAYFVMLLVSPYLNIVIEHASHKSARALLIGLTIASALMLLNLGETTPFSSVTYAITCYLIGAYIREYPQDFERLDARWIILSVFALLVWLSVSNYLGRTNKFFADFLAWSNIVNNRTPEIIVGTLIFAFVARQKQWSWSNKFINYLATGVFGIYLIHESHPGFVVFWALINPLLPHIGSFGLKMVVGLLICIVLYCVLLAVSLVIDKVVVKPIQAIVIRGISRKL